MIWKPYFNDHACIYLDKQKSSLEEEKECPVRMPGKLVVQDLLDQLVVTGGALAGVVGDEQVVAEEDDRGQEVADAGPVLVTLHQLTHPDLLKFQKTYIISMSYHS